MIYGQGSKHLCYVSRIFGSLSHGTGSCILEGFATHHQADVGGSQRTQHPLSGQIGQFCSHLGPLHAKVAITYLEVGRRSQPLPHALSIQFQQYDLMSGAIMSVYAQGQPPGKIVFDCLSTSLGLFTNRDPVYDDSQVNPNINVHHQILPLSVHGFAAGLEGLYNRDSDVPVPGSRTRQISDSMSEGAHLVYPQSSPPVPGRSVHLAAGPIEYSPPGTRLSDQPSHIHEGYTNSSPANTSGDLRTTGSLLFAEDSPQPKRKPPSRINHYTTVEQIPHPELSTSPRRSTRSRSTVNKAATLLQDNKSPVPPLPEGGIEGFCERSFPHERNLRDNLQVIMVSKKVENDDLEQFLETNDAGGDQRFKCLFRIESGQCGKTFKRKDKAGGHIRQVHIKMFPVPCQGHCGDPRW